MEEREASRDDARRARLLDAAVTTFLRYGFRKSSMEEVARAANVSRQALYLHYATKEALFGAAVRHFLESGLAAAAGPLRDGALPLEQRLAGAFDAWVGRFVGVGGDVTDLHEASLALVGPVIREHEERFVEAVTKLLRGTELPACYKAAHVSARQLAENLYATARGLKHDCASRSEFAERFGIAVRTMCFPLRERR